MKFVKVRVALGGDYLGRTIYLQRVKITCAEAVILLVGILQFVCDTADAYGPSRIQSLGTKLSLPAV